MSSTALFWLAVMALMVIACLFIVWPRLRHPNEPASNKLGTTSTAVLCLFVMVSATSLYMLTGKPQAISAPQSLGTGSVNVDPDQTISPDDIQTAITRVKNRLQDTPDDVEGWVMLARLYEGVDDTQAALDAFRNAQQLEPNDPNLAVELAKALAANHPQSLFEHEATQLLDKALQQQPMHQPALWFRGIAHAQQAENPQAIALWEKLTAQMPEGNAKTAVEKQIARLQGDAMPTMSEPQNVENPANQAQVTVQITLDDALRNTLTGNETLFVFARAPDGPPMPVAAKRLSVSTWPVTITLSDADRAMPTRMLSQFDEVLIGARISASGQAMPQSGDIDVAPQRVSTQAKTTHKLHLNHVRP